MTLGMAGENQSSASGCCGNSLPYHAIIITTELRVFMGTTAYLNAVGFCVE